MSNIYDRKRLFVEYDLTDLLQAIDDHILRCEYQVSDDRSMEICTIIWDNDSKRLINVTGDSLLAIAKDVLKYME